MAVVLDSPGGIAPKLRAENLPHPYSQICRGIDLRSGKFTARPGDRFLKFLQAEAKGFYFHRKTAYPLNEAGEAVSVDIIQPEGEAETRTFITSANQPLRVHIGAEEGVSARNVGAPQLPKPVVGILQSDLDKPDRETIPAVPGGFAISLLMQDGTESQLSAVGMNDEISRVGDHITISMTRENLADFVGKWDGGEDADGNFDFTGAKVLVYRATAVGEFRQVGTAAGFINNQADGGFGTDFPTAAERAALEAAGEDFEILTPYILGAEVGAPGAGSIGAPKENVVSHESGTLPRENMRHILLHPNRFLVAHTDRFVCFSEVEQFGVWPRAKEIAIPEGEILTIAEHSGAIWVFPKDSPPRVIQLDAPGGGVAQTTESRYPCATAGSVVNMGGLGLFYAAEDGIVRVPGGELLTADILDRSVPPNKWAPPTTAWAEGDEYVTPNHVLTPRSPHGGFMLAEKPLTRLSVISACVLDGCQTLLDANGSLWEAGRGERKDFVYKTRRMFFASRSSPARIRVVAKGVAQPRTSSFLLPRAYNFPAMLLRRDSSAPRIENDKFRAERAVGVPAPVKDFSLSPPPVGDGKITVRIITGGNTEDGKGEEEMKEFYPGKPKEEQTRADLLTQERIDAQAPLAKRTLSRWMEVEVSSTDGREVSYIVIDPHSDSLKLAANQGVPQIAVVPPYARGEA